LRKRFSAEVRAVITEIFTAYLRMKFTVLLSLLLAGFLGGNTIFSCHVKLRRSMPDGGQAVAITQNGASVPSQVVNGNLMFEVVPNGGDIVLSKLEKTASHSK
jgi:hypothetical protein